MAKSGHRTAVVKRKLIGGSCPNTDCLPSKNEIWSAKVADLVHHADRFGMVTDSVSFDMMMVVLGAIRAPSIWAGADPRIWRTLFCRAYMPYIPEWASAANGAARP
jgi:hypothetical protein